MMLPETRASLLEEKSRGLHAPVLLRHVPVEGLAEVRDGGRQVGEARAVRQRERELRRRRLQLLEVRLQLVHRLRRKEEQ